MHATRTLAASNGYRLILVRAMLDIPFDLGKEFRVVTATPSARFLEHRPDALFGGPQCQPSLR